MAVMVVPPGCRSAKKVGKNNQLLAADLIFSLHWVSLPDSAHLHHKAKMLVLLAGIFVVHIATVIMLFVSTIANVSFFFHIDQFIYSKVICIFP